MLYIKFNIQDLSKFEDFRKLYQHMQCTREPGFNFNQDNSDPEIDWDKKKTQEEIDAAVKELSDYLDQSSAFHRYQEHIPSYVNTFYNNYLEYDNNKLGQLGTLDTISIFNYLEAGFEVELVQLTKFRKSGILKFTTANYPFGGLERFFITLKAYHLIATECYNGFTTNKIEWTSNFEYNEIEIPKKNSFLIQLLHLITRS
ncbi:hypothetical protein KO494_01810 [Lacinutrix sp. C3R15]|uniref:hypothetical protein n=1 Tax=Flavobacteriaceae TaxID=49546 RepID=UPI001C08E992|nr:MULTISPECIES: hypothetical protein [Flavobacteriaceae]MBU2938265.1 hypothetical protein [Lacinutrix sp. C3R15]MDO6621579.1 hypothetical protein [Oceanihabitans sp. 1_MG-2023]